MKQLAKYFFLFLSIPAMAQHLEMGLSAGAFRFDAPVSFRQFKGTMQPMTSLKMLYKRKHYELGVDAGYRVISYSVPIPVGEVNFISPPLSTPIYIPTYVMRTSEIPVKAIANRTFTMKRLLIYGGLFLGNTWTSQRALSAPGETYVSVSSSYLFAGAQAGASWAVSKQLSINMEMAWECSDVHFHYLSYMPDAMLFPLSAGVRYRITQRANNH